MGNLENKVAVITGGSSGIGLSTAQRFVEEGAVADVTGRRQQELEAATAQAGAIAVQGDASNPADLDRLYDTVRGDGRRIDVLVGQANAILFLASDQGRYITGFELVVDDGIAQLAPRA